MKVCEKCGIEIFTKDGENRCVNGCNRRPKTKGGLTRKQRDEIMRSLGMTRVRGAMGGVYYE